MSLGDVWYGLLGFILFLATALDGVDLGIGILTLFCRDEARRAAMMSSIGSVWHANLTWLVVLGGLLFGAFPLAYSLLLSALYIPLAIMLWGLILRGISFDFGYEARNKGRWIMGFGLGSLIAVLAQGFIVGAFIRGFKVEGRVFAGGVWDWFTPLAALVALGLLCAYLLLGATYLIMKREGEIRDIARRQAIMLSWALLIVAVGIGAWGICKYPWLARRWFVWPDLWFTAVPMGLATAMAFVQLLARLLGSGDLAPFAWSLVLFFLSFLAMAASLYPCVIPPAVTVAEAAAPPLILAAMLAVTAVILPVMLIYNGYQYLVFGGKVGGGGAD